MGKEERLEEIFSGNKLISQFMGIEVEERGKSLMWRNRMNDLCPVNYHHSFDWLMPVVRKISELHTMEDLYKEHSKVTEALMLIDTSILFKAVVEFIKWHNSQQSA